jgi:hypothetical protein
MIEVYVHTNNIFSMATNTQAKRRVYIYRLSGIIIFTHADASTLPAWSSRWAQQLMWAGLHTNQIPPRRHNLISFTHPEVGVAAGLVVDARRKKAPLKHLHGHRLHDPDQPHHGWQGRGLAAGRAAVVWAGVAPLLGAPCATARGSTHRCPCESREHCRL